MRLEYTPDLAKRIERQKGFEEVLDVFQELLSEGRDLPLILHVRDQPGSSEMSTTCLDILELKVPMSNQRAQAIHRHCYNGGLEEVRKWRDIFPRTHFGFTGLITDPTKRHPEIREVIKELPMDKILLESDSPHLLPELFKRNETYNTPYGVEEVARVISEVRDLPLKEVIKACNENAEQLYRLLPHAH